MSIKHLIRSKIDVAKWDRCISKSFNGIIYAYSWYLDIVSPGWEALIEDDYERVMPLTVAEKYNILYIYQPYFCQQLGIFSIPKITPENIEGFLHSIPEKYKYVEINLNSFNKINDNSLINKENANYELDLISPYEKLYQNYLSNTKRNLKKAENSQLSLRKGISASEVVQFKQFNTDLVKENYKEHHFEILRKVLSFAILYKFGESYGVYTAQNEICAVAFFVMSHYRTILITAASNRIGKETCAMFFLIDKVIKNYCERNLTLDFEGSNNKGVARFYSGFGSQACKYLSIKINNLPWYIKLFKN